MQQYVYTLFKPNHKRAYGVFPTFKKAYEQIEKLELKRNPIAIIDVGDDSYNEDIVFDVIFKEVYGIRVDRYVICRNLLTVYPEDPVISIGMINRMLKEFEERSFQNKYKTILDVI